MIQLGGGAEESLEDSWASYAGACNSRNKRSPTSTREKERIVPEKFPCDLHRHIGHAVTPPPQPYLHTKTDFKKLKMRKFFPYLGNHIKTMYTVLFIYPQKLVLLSQAASWWTKNEKSSSNDKHWVFIADMLSGPTSKCSNHLKGLCVLSPLATSFPLPLKNISGACWTTSHHVHV